jgi:alkanesulfonate monooxygenase SsuD/methylene tetrahydromethanopterin reductase-like flavin-dependent oxidoreductase (luciferase family)
MKSWYFSEQSYYPAWNLPGSPKIESAAAPVDPEIAHRLMTQYLDECRLCDELGINIMVNEHHAAYTCMNVSCMLTLGTLAAITKNVRLLALGVPLLNRMDPLRVAEEIAYVDVLSRGRLEVGLIKGSTFELYVSNAHPVTATKRYWEAHDMVCAALTQTDAPFSWQSENFNYRYVSVIPRCYQQPKPPMWMTTLSTATARDAAKRGYVVGITAVARAARAAYPIYREEYLKTFGRPAPLDRLAYLGYVAVADKEEVAIERATKILEFVNTSERIPERFINPPGMMPHADNARILKAGETVTHRAKTLPDGTPMSNPPTAREQIVNSVVFAGTPDQVYEQIKRFYDSVGGFGHMLLQMGGTMTHEEIKDSLTLYARHVEPRLRALTDKTEASMAA